ncbi:MAG: LysR family transcriptional regulator [Pseudomonadota bacterium]
MKHWLEMRTALILARTGTVSAAARRLGVHRATVSRHIDTLESFFGQKLFQRHAKGYGLTEAGRDLLAVAERADELFAELAGRSKVKVSKLSGDFVISSLASMAGLLMPAIRDYRQDNPDIVVRLKASRALSRLELGEAHLALRAGPKPEQADYVVLPFRRIRFGLYASQVYLDRMGTPQGDSLAGHHLVRSATKDSRLPFAAWINEVQHKDCIVFETNHRDIAESAVVMGIAMGILPEEAAARHDNLVAVISPDDGWHSDLWLVTHADLHRTPKVQAFLKHAKQYRQSGLQT